MFSLYQKYNKLKIVDFRYEYKKLKNKVYRVKNKNRLSIGWGNHDGELTCDWISDRRWLHRVDGPAQIVCLNVGTGFVKPPFIYEIVWYEHGNRHRVGGPARIEYYTEEDQEVWTWYMNGWAHRIDGPAQIWKNSSNGSILKENWYLNGELQQTINY